MSKHRFSRLSDRIVYSLYRAMAWALDRVPLSWTFRAGQALGLIGYGLAGRYRRLALRNVGTAFPGWNPAERRRCVCRHFRTLGANLLCALPLSRMPWEKARRFVDLTAFERVAPRLHRFKAAVWVLSHLSNWELLIHAARWGGHGRHGAVYQPLRNPLVDAHLRRAREGSGAELIDRSAGLSRGLNLLRAGGILGILMDQHAGDHGVWTPFFGRLASTTPLAALLAKKTGAALVPVAVHTVGVARWRVEVEPFIEHRGASVEEVTSRINDALAAQIRRAPRDWFWVHRRWKTPSPRFLLRTYRRGVYVPARLAGRLTPFRVLVRSPDEPEAARWAAPLVRAIKTGRPDAHVAVLTEAGLAAFWQSVPEADEVLTIRPQEAVWRVARRLKQARFEVALLLPDSPRCGWEAFLAGIPRRVGYARPGRTWCLNQVIPEQQATARGEDPSGPYLRIAERIGAGPAKPVAGKPGASVASGRG